VCLFVGGSTNLTQGSAATNWTMTGAAAGTTVGRAIFRERWRGGTLSGGASAAATTTATFSGNINVIGNGYINLYGTYAA